MQQSKLPVKESNHGIHCSASPPHRAGPRFRDIYILRFQTKLIALCYPFKQAGQLGKDFCQSDRLPRADHFVFIPIG
jgi:hypothetical protein